MKKAVISILALIVIGTLSDLRALADNCSNKEHNACINDNDCYWAKNKLFDGDFSKNYNSGNDVKPTCVPRNSDRCFLDAGQFRNVNGECQTCPKGYYCPAYQMNAIRCPEGKTTAATGKSQQADCEDAINCTVYPYTVETKCIETAGCYVEIDSTNCYQYKDNMNTCLNDSDQNNCRWLDENGWLTEIGGSYDNTSSQGLFQWQQKVEMCNGRIVGNNPDSESSTFVGPASSFDYEDNHIKKCTDDSYCMWETENPEKVLCSLYDGWGSSYCDERSYGLCSYDEYTEKCTLKGTQGTLSDVCSDATDESTCSGIDMGANDEVYDACVWKNNECISIFNYCSGLSEADCKDNDYPNTCGWDNNENKCVTSFGYCKPTQCQKMTSSGWSCKTCTPGHYCEANSEEQKTCTNLATSPTAAGTADQCLHECTFITTETDCETVAGCYWNSVQGACDFCPEGYYCPANKIEKIECPFGGKSISPAKSVTDCYLGRRYEHDIELSHKICDNTGNCITIGPAKECTGGKCSPINLGKQKKALIYR